MNSSNLLRRLSERYSVDVRFKSHQFVEIQTQKGLLTVIHLGKERIAVCSNGKYKIGDLHAKNLIDFIEQVLGGVVTNEPLEKEE
ncbi:hypothetical protein K6754_23835 [Vibrio alginolyticus]|uniref:hypothetical protein n=1 Tax=Vibrio alginolyticus TaxID=663 RepID=UPI001EEFE89C|nr:hypothetical protein [Vibrio alginolyticus]EMC8460726.1 hypothetical protein [Vibrio alginolyticus]EME3934703.1 hypothetical protein [Vibrio alginolyticus]ULF93925.1 hypothetical protein K6754_23835 [Vibrio alginolyticus]